MASGVPLIKAGRWASRQALLGATILASGYAAPALAADALPTGGQFVAGAGAIQSNGVSATITQSSMAGIIDWQGFSIGAGNTVSIQNGAGATLNRVTGTDLSRIDGLLTATGSAFLINPNGIVVGPGGEVVTGGSFVASTRDIANEDFMDGGAMRFAGASEGDVVNAGRIVSQNGDVVLIGRAVTNTGTLNAAGEASLAAAGDVLLQTEGTGQRVFIQGAGPAGDVTNEGAVIAAEVQLAAANGNVYALAGNTDGVIRATGSATRNGRVLLTASGNAEISGTIEAKNADGSGGEIDVDAGDIALSGHVDVSAEAAGKNGGEAVLIADQHMSFSGTAEAKGGKGAAGGFVETSGKQIDIADTARVTTLAEEGETGTWLIDPNDLTVAASGGDITGATVSANLSGTNVTLDSDNGGSAGNGDIFINDDITWSANTTLTLDAVRNIEFNADVTARGNTAGLELVFGGEHIVNAGSVTLSGAGASLSLNGTAYTLIHDVTDLQNMEGDLAGNYALAVDIDASATSGWNAGEGFDPIGGVFSGTLDGFGHTITDLYVNRPSKNYVGLFAYLAGTVRNTGIVGGSIEGRAYAGGIAGEIQATGRIHRSFSTANITANDAFVGGLAGTNFGIITESFASGNVLMTPSGVGDAGGLVGRNLASGLIQDSYAAGIVEGHLYVGGLTGTNSGTLNNVYATGHVTARGGGAVGGLTGSNPGGTVTNGYYDSETTGVGGSGTSRTTSQMQSSLPSGFSSTVWGGGGGLYPYFKWRFASTPVAVKGTATIGGAAHAGGSVSILNNGALLDKLSTGANGAFYQIYDASQIDPSGVIGFLDDLPQDGAAFSNVLSGSFYGLTIEDGSLRVRTDNSSLTSVLGDMNTAFGGYSDADLDFISPTASNLNVTGALKFYSGPGNFILDGNMTATGDLTLYGPGLTAGSAGDVQIIAGGALGVTGVNGLTIGTAGDVTLSGASSASLQSSDIEWLDNSHRLTLHSGGNLVVMVGDIGNGIGDLVLDANGSIGLYTPPTIDLGRFELQGGIWNQVGTLPSFAADDFRITGGTFIRALGGNGLSATPYQIADIYGLQGIGSAGMLSMLTKHHVLANNIDASGTSFWNGGQGFNPIGKNSPFQGTLDGAGHAIFGLFINGQGTDKNGLFGEIGTAGRVENLVQTVGSVIGDKQTAGVAGINRGTITNVFSSVDVTGYDLSVGGLVGWNLGSITSSGAMGIVRGFGDAAAIGGLVGFNQGSIDLSRATGNVSGAGGYNTSEGQGVGGLVGQSVAGTISRSFAMGSVTTGSYSAGGFIGASSNTQITNSYATGNATGSSFVGGFAGLVQTSTIDNVYATGTASVTGTAPTPHFAGFVGQYANGTISNAFWNAQTSGLANAKGTGGGDASGITGLTTAQLRGLSTFTGAGWDIDDEGGTGAIWRIYDGHTAPLLRGFLDSFTVDANDVSKVYDGSPYGGGYTATYSGSAGALLGALGGNLSGAVNVGTYDIKGHYSDQFGYDITHTGTLTIDPAIISLSITPQAVSKVYGQTISLTGFNATGLQSGDSISSVTLTSAGTLAGANAGLYDILASNAIFGSGNASNYSITYVPLVGGLTVTPASLSVEAIDVSKTYGQADPMMPFSASGFVAGDDFTLITGAFSRAAGENAGSYAINLGTLSAGGNYTIDFTSADLTINPAALSVTANAASKIYGAADPAFTFTHSGLVNGDNASIFTGALSRAAGSDVGTYAINLGALSAGGNYTISFTGADFSITPASLSVTANALSKVYGAADPSLTFTSAGLVNGDDASVFTGALSRAAGETVAGGPYAITQGSLNAGGNYTLSFTGANFTITPATLAITANARAKIYGEAAPSLTFTHAGLANGDDASIITGALTRAAGETVAGGPYAISQGTLGANSNYVIDFTGAALTITPKALTVNVSANDKVYDGTVTATGTIGALNGIVGSDDVTAAGSGTFTFANKNVGTGKSVSVSGLTLSGANASNYTLSSTASSSASITPATLSVTAIDVSKIYGAADPMIPFNSSGFVGGDNASLFTGALTRAAGETVAGGPYAISLGTLSAGGNYTIDFTGAALTINPASLSVTANAFSKVYGGADPALTFTHAGLVNGDDASIITGALTRAAGSNAGTYAIGQGTLDAGSNYTLAFTGADFTITPASLTVAANALSKIYGNADPALTFTHAGLVNGDDVSIFTGGLTRAAGETVAGGPYAIGQGTLSAGGNYTISFTGANLIITPKALTVNVAANDKVYDGTTSATGTILGLNGIVGADSVTAGGSGSFAFADKNAGTGKAVSVTGLALSGADASNYTLSPTASSSASITPAALTVTADALSKIYGQADPSLTFTHAGFVGGDNASLFTGALSRAAGDDAGAYAINTGSLSAGGNYTIVLSGADFTITPAALSVTANALSKIYGEADPTLTYSYSGLVNGDDASIFTGALSRAGGETVAGGPYSIGQGSLSAGGNYTVSFTGADFAITPRTLTITAADMEKQEGDTLNLVSYFVNGLVAGDSVTGVTLTSPGTDAGAVPGTYVIEASNASGTGLSNYILTYADGQLTVTEMPVLPPDSGIVALSPRTQTVTWMPEDQPVGSGEGAGGFWSMPLFVNLGGSNVPSADTLTTASTGAGGSEDEDDEWNFLTGTAGRLTTVTTINVQDLRPLPQNGIASAALQ
ncbi:beta strand repeat-containing protein [Tepidicaulis sp. LMO-SS28]|uniref:beta strand repeat-containing protein n=1 Tax=Tepidicaulis sp. LMO-SS28 TaxID=3447455 RepID=UPI003EE26A19